MENCSKRLRELAGSNPGYRQAVENVHRDLRSPGKNPHGNIGPERARALAEGCGEKDKEGNLPSVSDVMTKYQTVRRPDLTEPIEERPGTPLRRVMSLTCFVAYHLGRGAESMGNVEELKEGLKGSFRERDEPEEYDVGDMRGATGKPDEPTWWTFREDNGQSIADEGERYLRELALSETDVNDARDDKVAVEVIVPGEILPESLYKPCALDSFDEDTRFRPDLSEAPFGRTVPLDPELTGRPELISRSLSYHEMNGDTLMINPLPIP